MEHILDSNEFLYDNRRICSKLYVFLKFIGLIFYTISLLTCYNPDFFIGMIVTMFLSVINSMRYEYAHFKRYGTIFSSINEFEEWKKGLYPKSRILFSMVEFIIKIVYFVNTFPLVCKFRNLCQIGESIFKIHILALIISYITVTFFSIAILCFIYFPSNRQLENISLQIPILVINNQNEECCICLDSDNTNPWSILPCGHKFHGQCISQWLSSNHTCPICRIYIS
jgi:hypothetical protein